MSSFAETTVKIHAHTAGPY